ncbi:MULTISPECIES: flagellar hook-length control protein FliK [unclassified Janthinobacterium]|uniref:flagellar hook-length control protein FliK n=1 Tax=unclassified Janthinobacterium TaxID=2610881 RepID=UPI0018139684|nr:MULTISPECIES: flagellar hook-length control protein FliK [unclassified Janthinobacterium]MBB5608703.1 flagellar hook-length control protein FliK [Janthinobacterium sp. S3T4]MBB5613894.1 flagellar hook-length control protein FliK [Janthinobacterium sp. S3M3]
MQTQPTPISQIVSPNATPGPANRSLPPAADGDFQRALDRQIEQRQLNSNAAQAQAAAPAPRNLPPQQAPQPPQAAQPQQAQQSQTPQPAGKAPAADAAPAEQAAQPATEAATQTKDGAETETVAASVATPALPPEDPAAAMLALVGSIKLAMQQPAAASKTVADTPGSALTGKSEGKAVTAAQLLASGKVAVDAGRGVSKGAAPAGDFADSLEQAQGKAAAALQGSSVQAGKADAGKLAIDLQVAATAKNAAPLAEPLLKEAPTDIGKLAAQLQPAALQQAAAAAAVPADKLAGRVGTPAWDQQLGQKVVWMAAGGDQSATLTLNPPDLGPLKVVLTVTNDQANAAFMSAQPEVRQALEAAMPRLREMMSEAGIAFGNATVSAGTQEQQNQGNRDMASDGRRGGHGNGSSDSKVTGGEIAIAAATGSRGRASLSAVDTFA